VGRPWEADHACDCRPLRPGKNNYPGIISGSKGVMDAMLVSGCNCCQPSIRTRVDYLDADAVVNADGTGASQAAQEIIQLRTPGHMRWSKNELNWRLQNQVRTFSGPCQERQLVVLAQGCRWTPAMSGTARKRQTPCWIGGGGDGRQLACG
jgi:hypothetical protein